MMAETDDGLTSIRIPAGADELPENLRARGGWSQFTGGFLIGGVGGALFAYLLLNSTPLIEQISQGL
ncbi:MAG: hypothetical protein HC924_19045 [Synechococcaceae cyanobacterium SM2_3_2]|nr:hypothetical protein [Synechococcaceae cyanobacterium SM2_3_2]